MKSERHSIQGQKLHPYRIAPRKLPNLITTDDVISDEEFHRYAVTLTAIFERAGLDAALIEFILSKRNLWRMTFTDRSFDATYNYEALEYWGDAVLSCFMREFVAEHFHIYFNGGGVKLLARLESNMVSKPVLSRLSKKLGFHALVRASDNVKPQKTSLQEDIFEAFVGAMKIIMHEVADRETSQDFMHAVLTSIYASETLSLEDMYDPKTMLKELAEKKSIVNNRPLGMLEYTLKTQTGSKNTVQCFLTYESDGRRRFMGEATNRCKKEAEKKAAQLALDILKKEGYSRVINRTDHI